MTTIKTHGAAVTYRDDKVLHIHYSGIYMNLEETTNVINFAKDNSPWKIAPIYVSAEPFSSHGPEAQKFLVSDYVMNKSSAVAILASNIAQKIAINMFIRLRKPSKPTKFFTNEKKAIDWLNKFETVNK